jgi:hypothetical protein
VSGHPEIVRNKSYIDDSDETNKDEIYGVGTSKYAQFAIDHWEGLISSIEPAIFDTGLVGTITIELTMAPDVVCPTMVSTILAGTNVANSFATSTGATQSVFKFSDMSLQLEVLSMATPVLDEVVADRIEQIGHISLPFKNYFSTDSSHTDSSRFNVNSASWDRVWICYRITGYNNVSAPRSVAGHKQKRGSGVNFNAIAVPTTAIVAHASVGGNTTAEIDAALDSVDTRVANALAALSINGSELPDCYTGDGVFDQARERYISNHFACEEDKTTNTQPAYYHLNVNGATLPQYHATVDEMYEITKFSVECDVPKTLTRQQYKKDFFIQCMRFCLPESDGSRQASGLDTRSTAAQASLNTSNVKAATNVVIFCECTSELRIGSGRSCAVMQ